MEIEPLPTYSLIPSLNDLWSQTFQISKGLTEKQAARKCMYVHTSCHSLSLPLQQQGAAEWSGVQWGEQWKGGQSRGAPQETDPHEEPLPHKQTLLYGSCESSD